ncbi:MAG: FKBP-type peptidyl-prolyl cis-trans isomerase [Bacteroidetes bacterium]|nr:FKBP-type peptidyl-prolyl cis-trans isomerase [Bacteroidota bacterium]
MKYLRAQTLVVLLILISALLVFVSCQQQVKTAQKKQISQDSINQRMITANIKMLKSEKEQINDYIIRYNWNMLSTGSGLYYMIYKHGSGKQAKLKTKVKISYKSNLLNGVSLYSSSVDGPKTFITGKAEVENGLEEGILLLKVGDKAKFIIPSHLAFGLMGDQKKIPRKATLVYDVELLEVNEIIK